MISPDREAGAPTRSHRSNSRDLLRRTKRFAVESRTRSWWILLSTMTVVAVFGVAAALLPWWPLRLLASIGMGLTLVRSFIVVHDFHHGAMFLGSRVARAILNVWGMVMLTPHTIWRDTHNYHHAHTAKTTGRQRGTFTMLTTVQWRDAGWMKRFAHAFERHPLTVLFGYVTVFLLSFCLIPFVRNPMRYASSGLALLVHGGLGTAIHLLAGPSGFVFAFLVPFSLASALGSLLFYVQHNFEGMHVPNQEAWNHTDASLHASSYLKLGPLMQWFTGNIGFHHVHHLNPKIPFYRLPAAMTEIPELSKPHTITLDPSTVVRSFRLKLWDADRGEMVSYRGARTSAS